MFGFRKLVSMMFQVVIAYRLSDVVHQRVSVDLVRSTEHIRHDDGLYVEICAGWCRYNKVITACWGSHLKTNFVISDQQLNHA